MAQATVSAFDKRYVVLPADVGGTHALVGLVAFDAERGEPTEVTFRTHRGADDAGLVAVVKALCDEVALKPQSLALAGAGFLHERAVVNSNRPGPSVPATIKLSLELDEVKRLNDFEALAYATAYLDSDSVTPRHGRAGSVGQPLDGPVVVEPRTRIGAIGAASRLIDDPPHDQTVRPALAMTIKQELKRV